MADIYSGNDGTITTTKVPTTSTAAPTSSKPTPPSPAITGSPADYNKLAMFSFVLVGSYKRDYRLFVKR